MANIYDYVEVVVNGKKTAKNIRLRPARGQTRFIPGTPAIDSIRERNRLSSSWARRNART